MMLKEHLTLISIEEAREKSSSFKTMCFLGNFIDTANKYQEGETETWIGEMLQKRGGRDGLVVATKYSLPCPPGNVNFCGNHRKNMFFALENSLKRLQTDYIDLYYGTISFGLAFFVENGQFIFGIIARRRLKS